MKAGVARTRNGYRGGSSRRQASAPRHTKKGTIMGQQAATEATYADRGGPDPVDDAGARHGCRGSDGSGEVADRPGGIRAHRGPPVPPGLLPRLIADPSAGVRLAARAAGGPPGARCTHDQVAACPAHAGGSALDRPEAGDVAERHSRQVEKDLIGRLSGPRHGAPDRVRQHVSGPDVELARQAHHRESGPNSTSTSRVGAAGREVGTSMERCLREEGRTRHEVAGCVPNHSRG